MEKLSKINTQLSILKGNDLKFLLKNNEILIKQSREVLQKVLDRLVVREKVIFLCDKNGYIIDMMGEISNIQYFFEHGFKLGVLITGKDIGNNAIEQALLKKDLAVVEAEQHDEIMLKDWTSIAVPVVLQKEINGIICILIKMNKENNQCKLIMELIRDYMSVLLKQCYNQKIDKSRFFGLLILDNKFKFTPKEIEVLYYLNSGERVKDLSRILQISNNTIKTHLKNIYGKMAVNNSQECIAYLNEYLNKYIDML